MAGNRQARSKNEGHIDFGTWHLQCDVFTGSSETRWSSQSRKSMTLQGSIHPLKNYSQYHRHVELKDHFRICALREKYSVMNMLEPALDCFLGCERIDWFGIDRACVWCDVRCFSSSLKPRWLTSQFFAPPSEPSSVSHGNKWSMDSFEAQILSYLSFPGGVLLVVS